MQRQLKILDAQLQLNHLIRIPDPIPKPANSFFRALSISLFSTHNQTQFVKSIMKQTLRSNCQAYQQNNILKKKKKQQIPFPLISQSSELIKNYINDKSMLQMYEQSPDLECFQNDNYQLASFTFNKRVSIFYLNNDAYLNQLMISSSRNKTGKKIILARLGKKFYAVEKQSTKIIGNFIKEYLLGNLLNKILIDQNDKQNNKVHFSGQSNQKVHFSGYDQVVMTSHKKFPKIHKKSLSECGDIMNKLEQFRNSYVQQIDHNIHTNIKNIYDSIENRSHQDQPKNLLDRDLDFAQKDQLNIGSPKKECSNGDKAVQIQKQQQVIEELKTQQQIKQQHFISQVKEVKEQQTKHIQQEVLLPEQKTQITTQQVQLNKIEFPINQPTQQASTENLQSIQQPSQAFQSIPIATQNHLYNNHYQQQNIQPVDYNQMHHAYYQNQYGVYHQNYQNYYPDYNNYYNNYNIMYQNQYYNQYYQPQHHQETYNTFTQPQQLVQNSRYQGKLKFYDQNGKYGFIIVDGIGSDLFVHFDDLSKAGISKQYLEQHSTTNNLRFEFTYYEYEGKNKKAKKAIDLTLLTQL